MSNQKIAYGRVTSVKSEVENVEETWEDIIEYIKSTDTHPEKAGPGLIMASTSKGRGSKPNQRNPKFYRQKHLASSAQMLCFDIEGIQLTPDDIHRVLPFKAVWWTSWSHGAINAKDSNGNPKWKKGYPRGHYLIPLSEPVKPEFWQFIHRRVKSQLEYHFGERLRLDDLDSVVDENCSSIVHAYYTLREKNPEAVMQREVRVMKGEPLDIENFPHFAQDDFERPFHIGSLRDGFEQFQEAQKVSEESLKAYDNRRHISKDVHSEDEIKEALSHLDYDDRRTWILAGMALFNEYDGDDDGFELWCEWAKQYPKWTERESRQQWTSFTSSLPEEKQVSLGTLFWMAMQAGWEGPKKAHYSIPSDSHVALARFAHDLLEPSNVEYRPAGQDNKVSTNVPLAFDEGSLWRYEKEMGIWNQLPDRDVRALVHNFDGAPIGEADPSGNGKRKRMKIFSGTAEGVLKCLRDIPNGKFGPGFFSTAPWGVQFRDKGFYCLPHGRNGHKIVEFGKTPEAKARFGFDYDYVDKPSKLMDEFLDGVFQDDEDSDREAKKKLLQEFCGACLFGMAHRFQKFLLLVDADGSGSNGKSTFLKVLKAVFPEDSVSSVLPTQLGDQYYRADLAGRRINIVTEMTASAIVNSEPLKAVVTADTISGRFPRGEVFTFTPTLGFAFACNELPSVVDMSGGFWRRPMLVEFTHCFENDPNRDRDMDEKLISDLPRIVAWMVEGARRLLRQGKYTVPESSKRALDQWRIEANPIAEFADQKLEESDSESVRAQLLYDHFIQWAERNGHRKMSSQTFYKRFAKLGFVKTKPGNVSHYKVRIKREGSALPTLDELSSGSNVIPFAKNEGEQPDSHKDGSRTESLQADESRCEQCGGAVNAVGVCEDLMCDILHQG